MRIFTDDYEETYQVLDDYFRLNGNQRDASLTGGQAFERIRKGKYAQRDEYTVSGLRYVKSAAEVIDTALQSDPAKAVARKP